jgi:hypothetical protein
LTTGSPKTTGNPFTLEYDRTMEAIEDGEFLIAHMASKLKFLKCFRASG